MKRILILSSFILAVLVLFSTNTRAQVKQITPVSQPKDIEALVDRYFVSLNDPDDKRRRDLLKEIWAEKGTFVVVPIVEGSGLAAIDEVTKGGITKFPGCTVRRTSKIDGSGVYYKWNFTLSRSDGTPVASGSDYATIVDGKLVSVIGFVDQ